MVSSSVFSKQKPLLSYFITESMLEGKVHSARVQIFEASLDQSSTYLGDVFYVSKVISTYTLIRHAAWG